MPFIVPGLICLVTEEVYKCHFNVQPVKNNLKMVRFACVLGSYGFFLFIFIFFVIYDNIKT